MRPFRFIHTADLHLDTPFSGISELSRSTAEVLFEATFTSFSFIINRCIEQNVDFLLISGDIYNSRDQSLRAQLRFREGMQQLDEHGIRVYISFGNHDPLNGWSAHIAWPSNVHIFGGNSVTSCEVLREGEHIADIHGISYKQRDISDNLSKGFPDSFRKGVFSIGLLHCNVGNDSGHQVYAPCTLNDLSSKGIDYWALGHIHTPKVLKTDSPAIIYPGSPQGLNPKETGPRGCYEVSVGSNGHPHLEFIHTDTVRWEQPETDISGLGSEQELIDSLNNLIQDLKINAENSPVLCRIRLTGRTPIHSVLCREGFLEDLTAMIREQEESEKQFVWVERIEDMTSPELDVDALRNRDDFLSDLILDFEGALDSPDAISEIQAALEPLFASQYGRKYLDALTVNDITELIRQAQTLALDRLAGGQS